MTEKDAAGDAVGAKLAPAGLGCITLIFGIGQAIGPAVAGYIKDSTGSFTGAFALSAAVSLAGVMGSLFLRKKPSRHYLKPPTSDRVFNVAAFLFELMKTIYFPARMVAVL